MESRFPFRSAAAIKRAQIRRLRATVEHAYEHVPFYREAMRKRGLGPGDIRTVADLASLPLLDRERVQSDPEYFASRAEPLESYVELRTAGSTAEPLTLLYHPFSLFEQAIYSERGRSIVSRLARRRRYREARIANVSGAPSGGPTVQQAFRGLSLISPALRMERRQWAHPTPLEELIEGFNEFEPDVIASFGSFHELLFTHLLRTGRRMWMPKVALYAGDGMSESARAMINREFGIQVLSVYTAGEAFQIGFECERHRGHHLNLDLFPVRIVSSQGRELPPGESGEVVVSNLQARGTILLNYRLNDIAARLPDRCPCGRTLPLLSWVQGRSDEWVEDSEGRHIHSHSVRGILQREADVLRFQVIQESRTRFTAALVAAPDADRDAIAARLGQRFRDAFGEATEVETSFVDSLPRTEAGKVRP